MYGVMRMFPSEYQATVAKAAKVAAYRRITEKAETAAAEKVEPQWLGGVGDKIEFTGTVTTALSVDGYTPYSPSQNLIVVTTETGLVKFCSSAEWTYDLDRGDVVTAAATIKALDTWNGLKQTVVVRPRKR